MHQTRWFLENGIWVPQIVWEILPDPLGWAQKKLGAESIALSDGVKLLL